jgi:hypothetical protein
LLDLYNFLKPYHKRVRISTIFVEPFSITDSKQACPVFQEEGDGLLPLVTRCENSLFEETFLPKGCFQNKRGRKKERVLYQAKCIMSL